MRSKTVIKSATIVKRCRLLNPGCSSLVRCVWLALLLPNGVGFTGMARAEDVAFEPVVFAQQYCIDCHRGDEAEADFRLDDVLTLDAEQRAMRWHKVQDKLSSGEMPPADTLQPSSELREQALEWFRAFHVQRLRSHWSLQPPTRPEVPIVPGAIANPIDAFVQQHLNQHRLKAQPQAERRVLLRRLFLDCLGIPPTPSQLAQFVSDPRPTEVAWRQWVDYVLASPRFGERWAQHWLDVIRWAETVGFETNRERPFAWHYRDWVIDSINDDTPYDQFVRQQLVGDLSGEDPALGFLVAGPANLPGQIGRDEEAMRQARQDELDEVIRTVSQSLFGLTIGCARCHDHKFDPITQRDYYSMQAIFAGLRYGNRRLRGPQNDRWAARVPELDTKLRQLKQQVEAFRTRHQLKPALKAVQEETFEATLIDAVRMTIKATEGGAASLYEFEVFAREKGGGQLNVALASRGGRPSASSFALANQTRHFDNLVDGSVDKRQAFPWVAAKGGPAWVQVELADPTVVDRIRWHAGSSMPADYLVEIRDPETQQWSVVADTDDRMLRFSDRRSPETIDREGIDPESMLRLTKLLANVRRLQSERNRLAAGPQVYAASFVDSPDPTWLLHRGDPMQPTEFVQPVVPHVLQQALHQEDGRGDNTERAEVDRRIGLTEHLLDPNHPLTSRVIVNRIWQHHFGIGIVETPSDFGRTGQLPTHPELLDWLATELVRSDWSMKRIHRLILSSATYRRSSLPELHAQQQDAESRYLWRYPPRRLDAEAIRDSILFVSGRLNLEMHGRGFDFFQQRGGLSNYRPREAFSADGWRRMIYGHKIRMQSIDIFGDFDCPDAGQMRPRRHQSVTPLQSLGLFNSPFAIRQSSFLADRIQRDLQVGHDEASRRQIEYAFELVYARRPDEHELERLAELAAGHGLEQVCRVLINSSEFLFLH